MAEDNIIPFDKYLEEPLQVETFLDKQEKILKEMNEHHKFIHSYNGKPAVVSYIWNEVYDREVPEFSPPETIKMRYANKVIENISVNGRGKEIVTEDVGSWWLKHPQRDDYSTIGFEPKEPRVYTRGSSRLLNMWDGFAVESIYKKNGWKKFRKHIYNILCNKDHVKFKYVIKWFAWLIQNPGKPAEVCMVFKGKQGAGKSMVLNQFLTIFGHHGMKTGVRNHLTGQYNAHLQFKCFLLADEAYYPGDREVEGTLKQLITEHKVTIEPKFVNAKLSNNCLHICMSTNNEWVIPANEDERRYFVNTVDNTYAKNQMPEKARQRYFGPIYQELDNGGREALLYDLEKLDLKGWHPRYHVPETEELQKQIYHNLNKFDKSMCEFINAGMFPGKQIKNKYVIEVSDLIRALMDMEPGAKHIHHKALNQWIEKMGLEIKRDNGERAVEFLELGLMRQLWDEKVNIYNWTYYGGWDMKGQPY
jgi:hypothetical protein